MSSKSLLSNSLYNLLYRGLNVLFPLITVTYVSRILLAEGVGRVTSAQNVAQYFVVLAALGIPNYGIREIAKKKDSEQERNKLFSELFFINLISTLVFTLAYYGMICIFPTFEDDYFLHLIVGTSVVLNAINVDWFYQGMEEYHYIAIRSFIVKIISLVLIFVFIRSLDDLVWYAGISCFAICGNNILNVLRLRKFNVRLQFKGLSFKPHMKPIMYLLASVISVELYTLLDTTMVSVICGDEEVGYYTNAMKLIKLLITFVTAIGGVLLPRLTYHHKRGEEKECSNIVSMVFSIMLFVFVPCQIGIFMISDEIICALFGSSFLEAGVTLRIASFLICTLGFSNLFGTQVLLTYGREKLLLVTTCTGAISNIAMNAIFIPMYAQNGAAFASVISETLVTLLSFIFASKFIKMKIDKKYIFYVILSSLAMIGVVSAVDMLVDDNILTMVLAIVFGAVVYLGINIIAKNPIINTVKENIMKK